MCKVWKKPALANISNSTEAVAVVTCTDGSTAIYYSSPDKSLHPIRFIWAWHPAGIFYPLLFLCATLMDSNDRQRNTFPTTLTPCGQLPLTRPQISSAAYIGSEALGEGKQCRTNDINLKARTCSYLVFIYSDTPAGMNTYCTGRLLNS